MKVGIKLIPDTCMIESGPRLCRFQKTAQTHTQFFMYFRTLYLIEMPYMQKCSEVSLWIVRVIA